MNLFPKILLIAVVVATAGCAISVPLQRAQISAISREATPANLNQILADATVVAQTEFQGNGKSYLARHYLLQTATRQDMSMVCTPTCIPIFITVPVTTQYVVIQRLPERSLHAWGTLEELSKDPDAEVSSLMPIVKQRLEEFQNKK